LWSFSSENQKQKTGDCQHLQGNKGIVGFNQTYGAELRGFDSRVGNVLEKEARSRWGKAIVKVWLN
jgi:hypothetical protein